MNESARDQHRDLLARAERLAALREIVAVVAHDLNQPLASIAASGEAALRWLDREEPALAEARASLKRVLTHKDRAARIIAGVRDTLAVEGGRGACDLAVAARLAASKLIAQTAAATVEVEAATALAPGALGPIEAELMFHHLLRNGLEAMQDRPRPELHVRLWCDQAWVLAEVRDRGCGIPQGDRAQVFSPFFSTKPGADGLGLCVARSVARGAGGRLEVVESGPDGTVLRAWIPRPAADPD